MGTSGEGQASQDLYPYRASGQAQGGAIPPLEPGAGGGLLGADSGLLGALVEIVSVETSALHGVLAAWQREQDRLANRAWRRPGGMARPAGL